jgi:LysM repeat protein
VAQLASGDAQEITPIPRRGEIIVNQPGGELATATATSPAATPITIEPTATSITVEPTATPAPTLAPDSTPNAVLTPTPAPDAAPPTAVVQATLVAPDTPMPTATFTPVPPPEALIIDKPLVHIPPNATFGRCYRVMPEDTIETIAMFFGTTPQAINLANDLYPPYMVQRYQHIFVPQIMGHGPNVYQLQPGDTLNSIAEACKLPVTMLARVNQLHIEKLPSGANTILQTETLGLRALIIPIPPYPPPARYQYPRGPIPVIPYQEPYPTQKNHPLSPYN